MTDLIDRADSGEIPRYDDLGEPTQNLARYLVDTPSFEAIPRRTIDLDDTVTYLPATIGVVDLEGPPPPPPPLPPNPDEPPATERLSLLGSLGAELPQVLFPPSCPVPVAAMVRTESRGWWARLLYRGQHRAGAR